MKMFFVFICLLAVVHRGLCNTGKLFTYLQFCPCLILSSPLSLSLSLSLSRLSLSLSTSLSLVRQTFLSIMGYLCNISNFDSNHSDTFFSVIVFLHSRHKQIPKKHHINAVSTSPRHISYTHVTLTHHAADLNIIQSVLTRRHLSQSLVRAGKMIFFATCTAQSCTHSAISLG